MKKISTLLIALTFCFYFASSLGITSQNTRRGTYLCECPSLAPKKPYTQTTFTGARYISSDLSCAYEASYTDRKGQQHVKQTLLIYFSNDISDPMNNGLYQRSWRSADAIRCDNNNPEQCLVMTGATNCRDIVSYGDNPRSLEFYKIIK